jgi:O-antigen ligase
MIRTWQDFYGEYTERPALFVVGALGLGLLGATAVVLSESFLWLLVMTIGFLLLWIVFFYPDLGLALLVFAVYTRFSDVMEHEHGIPSFVIPMALLLLGVMGWRWWFSEGQIHNWENTAVLLGIYGLVCFSSLLYAADPSRSQYDFVELVKNGLLMFTVVLALRHHKSLRYTIWALLAAGIFMGTLSVYQQLTGTFENPYAGFAQTQVKNIVGAVNDYRVAGPVGDPNFYAMTLVVLVPLALDRVWHEKNTILRLLAVWALLVSLLTIVFTFSRGGFIALVIVLLLMVLRQSLKPLNLLLSLVALFVVWQFVPTNYTDRLATTLNLLPGSDGNAYNDSSFRGRTSEVVVAWQIFVDHPLLGVGLNNYKHYYQEDAQPLGWDNRREERSAHNLYLEVAAETGLLGLAGFGAILGSALWGAYQAQKSFMRKRHYDEAMIVWALIIGIAGYLFASLFLHGAYDRYFWLLMGILLALPAVASTVPIRTHSEPIAEPSPTPSSYSSLLPGGTHAE